MTRTIFAIAMAVFAVSTYFSPAANACISCEYTPPVVNTPVYSHGSKVTKRKSYSATKRKSYTATKKRRVKKHIAKTPSVDKAPSKTAVIKPTKKPDTVETASISEDEPEVENSSITTAANDDVEIKEAATTDEAQATNVGCKKFFASVGMTLTVPCK